MGPTHLLRYIYLICALLLCLTLPSASASPQGFDIDDSKVIKTPDGTELSLLIIKPLALKTPQPTALMFTIYAEQDRQKDIDYATRAARRGYISVMAYARGKHLSRSHITPYETEVTDVNAVIDWLARQPWSNGEIGMYGGSYSGFAQWSAAKNLHPALKTMVPYVAHLPGHGLPMQNNVFINANYGWPFHVTNNRYKDDSIYQQGERWQKLNQAWFESDQPYRRFDSFDKRPNPWLQTWLAHPGYDEYWQSMVAYDNDFQHIDVPVLSITGYYDDGQVSALHYLNEHYKHRPNADHYLVIGPYDHWTAQTQTGETLRGMSVDPVARIDTHRLTFDWMDYIFRGAPKPALLKDKINYQLMGINSLRHAPSMQALNANTLDFYMTPGKHGERSQLVEHKPAQSKVSELITDLRDRTRQNSYYPWPIITEQLPEQEALVFETPPFEQPMELGGQFSLSLDVRINKRDFDLAVTLYEQQADGRLFHLGYYLGRASYNDDMSERTLLTPGEVHSLDITRTWMTGKKIAKGSTILLVASVNKNSFAQVNYGTGKDVSDESIADAGEPLKLEWLNTSVLHLPTTPSR